MTQLVNEHQTALRRMCFFLLHDASAAEAAVQATFLKAYKALPAWQQDGSAKSRLMYIALSTCRNMARSGTGRHTKDEPTEAIRHLPRNLQDAVLLYYYQDMTLQEVADALHTAPSTVSKRLAQAHKILCPDLERREIDG